MAAVADPYDGYKVLKQVSHDATSAEEIKKIYDNWALNYEKDTSSHGYIGHKTCTDAFDAHMEKAFPAGRHDLRVMDAGAGTGIVGEHLKDLGYTAVDGLDISAEMLKVAEGKKVYKKLICAPISEQKVDGIATGQYHGVVCSGTITVAHVKAASFDEILRWIKPGGIFCFTIRKDALETEEYGYQNKMDDVMKAGKCELLSKELTKYHKDADQWDDISQCYIVVLKCLI